MLTRLPTKTPTDVLTALIEDRARVFRQLVDATTRIGERFTSIAEALPHDAFSDVERTLVDACADALALTRLAALLRALDVSIALLSHVPGLP